MNIPDRRSTVSYFPLLVAEVYFFPFPDDATVVRQLIRGLGTRVPPRIGTEQRPVECRPSTSADVSVASLWRRHVLSVFTHTVSLLQRGRRISVA